MGVLAQHGFGGGIKVEEALDKGYIDGCIYSPKDIQLSKLKEKIDLLPPKADIYFDPQYYATIIAQEPNAKLGNLVSDYAGYFSGKNFRELRREKNVAAEVEKTILFQKNELNLHNIIVPNILLQDGLNSASSNIAKTFLEIGSEIASDLNVNQNALLTFALDQSCFRNTQELLDLADEITGLGLETKGFYILVETSKEDGVNPWFIPEVLAGQMYLAYALAQNGYRVVYGYSFLPSPYLWVAGAKDVASGWFNTQRYFSLNKFRDIGASGRKANRRYFSDCLWLPVEWTQVQSFRSVVDLMNGFGTDELYLHPSDEKRPNETDEVLQYWETLKKKEMELHSLRNTVTKVEYLLDCIEKQNVVLTQFKRIGRLPFGDEILRNCQRSLYLFAELAELSLSVKNA